MKCWNYWPQWPIKIHKWYRFSFNPKPHLTFTGLPLKTIQKSINVYGDLCLQWLHFHLHVYWLKGFAQVQKLHSVLLCVGRLITVSQQVILDASVGHKYSCWVVFCWILKFQSHTDGKQVQMGAIKRWSTYNIHPPKLIELAPEKCFCLDFLFQIKPCKYSVPDYQPQLVRPDFWLPSTVSLLTRGKKIENYGEYTP